MLHYVSSQLLSNGFRVLLTRKVLCYAIIQTELYKDLFKQKNNLLNKSL